MSQVYKFVDGNGETRLLGELSPDPGTVQVAKVVLDDTAVKALPTPASWPTIVPAPAATSVLLVLGAYFTTNWGNAHQYTGLSSDYPASELHLAYTDDFQLATITTSLASALNSADGPPAGKLTALPPDVGITGSAEPNSISSFSSSLDNCAGMPLKLVCYNTAGNFTGGNAANRLSITVAYMTATI